MTDEQIKHMVNRFLGWKLPENFHPDGGVKFDADAAKKLNPRNLRYEPYGTNLLDYTQASLMVRHMIEGLPENEIGEASADAEVFAGLNAEPSAAIDKEMSEFLEGVVGVVEANSYERHMLWDENRRRDQPDTWETISPGLLETVGHLGEMPVCISLLKVRVGGQLLLMMHPTSRVVDHEMVREWMRKTLPRSAFWPDGHVNCVDAMNFHNVFRAPAAREQSEHSSQLGTEPKATRPPPPTAERI